MSRYLDETFVCLILIGGISIYGLVMGNGEIANTGLGGLLGFLTRGAVK